MVEGQRKTTYKQKSTGLGLFLFGASKFSGGRTETFKIVRALGGICLATLIHEGTDFRNS